DKTASTYTHLAACLEAQGNHADALPLFQKALAIRQKVLGEQHRFTAESYRHVSFAFYRQGKYADPARNPQAPVLCPEFGRLQAAESGFERALFRAADHSPHAVLAMCKVRLDKPLQAWEHAESDLARSLLDDLLPASDITADADKLARLHQVNQALIPL